MHFTTGKSESNQAVTGYMLSDPANGQGCWLWSGTLRSDGYGVVRIHGRVWRAHRLVYINFVGPIPEGHDVLHKCDVRRCVNPDHLFTGTDADNHQDKARKGRHWQQQKTHCPKGHPYTEENTVRNSEGHRRCRVCKTLGRFVLTSLLAVTLLGSCLQSPPTFHLWKEGSMHEALALACGRKEAKQLSLEFTLFDAFQDSLKGESQPCAENISVGNLPIRPTGHQSVNVALSQPDQNTLNDTFHFPNPQSIDVKGMQKGTSLRYQLDSAPLSTISDSVKDAGVAKIVRPSLVDLLGPSPKSGSLADTNSRLPLDFILGPKGKSITERVCARLVQAEAHETNSSLRSDYRQAFICVSLASKGNTEPFLSSSYAMYGIHPDKVWPRIVANRKERLGREYYDHFDSNDMPRPDVPKFKKPPMFEPEPNDRLAALLSSAVSAEAGEGTSNTTPSRTPSLVQIHESQKEKQVI